MARGIRLPTYLTFPLVHAALPLLLEGGEKHDGVGIHVLVNRKCLEDAYMTSIHHTI